MRFIVLLLTLSVLACSQEQQSESSIPDASADNQLIHDRTLTLDSHIDISFEFATDAEDPLTVDNQVNLEKMREGGLDAGFFIVYVGQTERTSENYKKAEMDAMTKFNAIHRMTEELYPDRIGLAYSPSDIERLVAEGKLAAAIGIENGFVFGTDLSILDRYFELGARYVTLVHNGHNDIAYSAQPRPQLGDKKSGDGKSGDDDSEHDGISEFGAAAIKRMNELGIMVDISHASKQSALKAIELSTAPVIASHSSIYSVTPHPRNLDDETLLALRDNGGVVHIVAFDSYVHIRPPEFTQARTALNEQFGFEGRARPELLSEEKRVEYIAAMEKINTQWPPATVSQLADHIDYAVKLIGIDHVGISSDFGGGGGIVGWSNAVETPNVTVELISRGYSQEDIGKLWSGNLLRVWREVEKIASRQPEQEY